MLARRDPQGHLACCPAGVGSTHRRGVGGDDPGYSYHCAACRLRSQCNRTGLSPTVTLIESRTRLWRLREQQKTDEFRARYRKRVVVERRIARLVQLAIRQAK